MTTKNLEFDFDLQMFALPAQVTLKAVSSSISANGSQDFSEGTAVQTWVGTDSTTGNATVLATTTVQAYNFSGSSASVASDAIQISVGTNTSVVTTVYDSSDAVVGTPTSVTTAAANTNVPSPLWLAGGGNTGEIVIDANHGGTITAYSTQDYIRLTASGTDISLTGLYGQDPLRFKPHNGAMNNTLNDVAVNFAVTDGNEVSIYGGATSQGNPTIATDNNATVSALANQTWYVSQGAKFVNGASSNAVSVEAVSDTAIITSDTYLSASVSTEGGAVGLAGTSNDTISFNGRTISNAGRANATLTYGNETLVTAQIGLADASLNAGTVGGMASLAANATASITGAASVAAITAVDSLASGGRWTLGSSLTTAQLGSDTVTFSAAGTSNIITASTVTGSAGTKIAGISSLSAGNVTLAGVGTHDNVSLVSGSANWGYTATATDSTIVAVFDTVGSMSLGADTSATVKLNSRTAKVLGVGANDSLSLNGLGSATVASGLVTNVDSLSASGQWTVKGGSGERSVTLGQTGSQDTFAFQRANSENTYGVITAGTNGSKVVDIDDLSGDVSVASASISGLTVIDNTWSISGAAGSIAAFDSLGTGATVTAQSDLTVAATSDATVAVNGQSTAVGGKFNNVTVATNDSDSLIVVQLEGVSDTVVANLAGITSLNSAATVVGDASFTVNDVYTVQNLKSGTANTQFSVGSGSSAITIQSVKSGDIYSVTGGNVVYDVNTGTALVTVNGAQVSITAATTAGGASQTKALINAANGDPVVSISGVKLNDVINTASDDKFTVVYNTLGSAWNTTDTYVMKANNVGVSLNSGNIASTTAVTMSVDNSTSSSSLPRVTISGSLSNSSTISVGSGVYNVGSSAAVTINETLGYLYLDSAGNVTAEDNSVADVRKYRDESLNTLAASQDSLGATVNPYEQFYNIYSSMTTVSGVTTVAGYTSATVTATGGDSTVPVTSGVNIYGDTSLNAYPEQLTLQSYLSNPIAINHIEGVNSAHTVRTAVVDARGGSASVIALGMDTTASNFATNHTIYGSNRASTIMVGPMATGNHMVRAGSIGSYLYHNAGGQGGTASIFGGAGNDTIIAEKGDHVEGGSGADVFFDSQSYEISDYRPEEGDLIVATKLSATASERFSPDNLVISGNTVAIAGGSTITIGSNYDEATATRAAITDASATTRKYLIWAGTYESTLDASSLDRGIMMISTQNGGAADTVIGSASADTIYAGGNDSVNSGAGNDIINLKVADTDTGQRGATVVLSAGRNEVIGWKGGFANDEGANILQADAASTSFRTRNGVVTATNGEAVMSFSSVEADSTGAYGFLVGDKKVTFIAEGQSATVSSNDNLADIYKADKAGEIIVTSDVTTAITANIAASDTFTNVTSFNVANNNRATLMGSSASERFTLSGARDTGASKSIMSGGGNDLIVSGGINSTTASLVAGNHFFFGTGNASYSAGRDTIQGFNYYTGKDNDPDGSGADVLHLGNYANLTGASVMSSRVEISLGDSATVVISDTFTSSADKIVRTTFDDLSTVYNVKFGVGGTTNNNFTYDGETDYFWGNDGRSRDTLNVASNLSNVNIWLENKDLDKVYYRGIGVINAGSLTDTKATLVGNYSNSSPYSTTVNNTIIGGGAGTQSSLWGGGGESNSLVGGDGYDEFFYVKSYGYTDSDGNRHGSRDVITNVTSEDLIRLYDVTFDDLDLENTSITSTAISVALKDQNGIKGGSITVTGFGQETNFKLGDGSTYKAVVRGNNVGWE